MECRTNTSRKCFSCKNTYPFTAEFFYRSNVRFLQRECKECNKIRRSRWWKSDKGKLSSANTKLKRRFNLSLEEYNMLLTAWNGRCGICGATKSVLNHRLAVDHDHKTGQIRGILCKSCNIGLGNFKDSVDFLLKAGEYLKNYVQFKGEPSEK